MILHGIEAPNIINTNTLTENPGDIQDRDRFDIVFANPPFGGKECKEVQQNFPIKTGETAFLQRFIKKGTPWAHLDIAGMAWSNKPGTTYGKGATGYGVRLLDQYVRDVLEG